MSQEDHIPNDSSIYFRFGIVDLDLSYGVFSDQNAHGKKIILLKHQRAYRRTRTTKGSKRGCNKNVKIFPFLCTKDIAKSCFYSPVKLKRVGVHNTDRRKHFLCSRKMKREEIARETENTNNVDSAAYAGNKVLPITEERNDQCDNSENKDKVKGDKKKAISRMKELLRWAAAAKTEKGGKPSGRKVNIFNFCKTLYYILTVNLRVSLHDT